MAKMTICEIQKGEEENKVELFDEIPKYSQQPRSSPPKRRTDFSLFFSYSSLPSIPDISASPNSSLSEVGELEKRRGKRERKPRIHFDELISPIKSPRKARRFRIMRHLGLAAPIGSPF